MEVKVLIVEDNPVARSFLGRVVRESFSDTLEELDLGAMGMFEARKGRHGLLVDGQYAKLSSSVPVPVPMVGATLPVQLKTRMVSGLFAYRHGWIENETTQVDLVAGVRVWSARVRVAYAVPVPTPPRPSGRLHW